MPGPISKSTLTMIAAGVLLLGLGIVALVYKGDSPTPETSTTDSNTNELSQNLPPQLGELTSYQAGLAKFEEQLRHEFAAAEEAEDLKPWREFSASFSGDLRSWIKDHSALLTYDEPNHHHRQLVEALTLQSQQLLFLWREMNTTRQGGEGQIDLADAELTKAKAKAETAMADLPKP